ncbi:MAG: hypothetical protein HYS07_10250 [Chlamydiae bacterium]|nr:hypothetical protein [Chlamydiota bacterium]MBI3277047.1 hypothetical protein [Chlamydiota bacterium]
MDVGIRILPDLQFSILCDDVRREHNGKLILLGLFETIGAARFPVVHPTLFVVNRWCNGVGEYRQNTVLRKPDNSVLAEDEVTMIQLNDLKAKHTVIARFNNLRFEGPGEYAVEIRLDGELKIRYPVVLALSRS